MASCGAAHLAALALLMAGRSAAAACLAGDGTCRAAPESGEQLLIQVAKATSASVRRHSASPPQCQTAQPGDSCHTALLWAKHHGVTEHPEWYPGLCSDSTLSEFQEFMHQQGHHGCGVPCPPDQLQEPGEESACCAPFSDWRDDLVTCGDCTALVRTAPHGGRCDNYCSSFGHVCVDAAEEVDNNCEIKHAARCDEPITGTSDMMCKCRLPGVEETCSVPLAGPSTVAGSAAGGAAALGGMWQSSGEVRGEGWCAADVPASGWDLRQTCAGSTEVRVLSYNLFWWNLFGQHGGNGGSAGHLIASRGPFDIMGFQECEDVNRVLRDAGLADSYDSVDGGSALAIAYRSETWEQLGQGRRDVAEDRRDQYYGNRAAHWVRLRHRASGDTVLFVNHHGPLPVNTGGVCGGTATAYNLLKAIATHAETADVKILVGDFNAEGHASTQATLTAHMHRAAHHWVDGIFGSCPGSGSDVLGRGGSDHHALAATFRI